MGKKSLKIMFFESNFTDNIEFLRENFENSIFFHVNFAIFPLSGFFTSSLRVHGGPITLISAFPAVHKGRTAAARRFPAQNNA